MLKTKKLRAVLYARYSTDKQSKESAEDQFRVCRRVAEREGMQVVGTYSDPGISGGTAQRPQYQELRKAGRAREFDVVIAEDLKRLWREQAEQWACIKEWLDLGIHIVTASGIDSRQKGFSMLASVVGAAAELERKESGYRTRRGQEGKAIAGKATGGRAYGYDTAPDPKGRTINREEARIVVRIFKMRRDGMSPRTIARKLNAEGIASPGASWNRTDKGVNRKNADKGWRSNAIAGDPAKGTGILNNPLYIGQVIWGRTRWERSEADSKVRKVEYLPPEQWIRNERPDLRIVPDDLWHAVQEIQTRRDATRDAIRLGIRRSRVGGRGRGPGYWLSSIIVCARCDANYIGYGPRDYICPTHIHGGKCSNGLHFNRDATHGAMFDLLRDNLLRPEIIESERKRCAAILRDQEQSERSVASRGIDTSSVDAQIAQLKTMRNALSQTVFNAAMAAAEHERAALLAASSGKVAQRTAQARKAVAALSNFAEEFRTMLQEIMRASDPCTVERAREATRSLIHSGRVALGPTAKRDAVTGQVALLGLGAHVLRLTGTEYGSRSARSGSRPPFNNRGSGGRI